MSRHGTSNGQKMTTFDIELFEESSRQNGICYWLAHDFMLNLGYETWTAFNAVIRKAMAACSNLGIDADEVFIATQLVDEENKPYKSYKLTRFACFLITMYADDKKPQVAQAKIALSAIAAQLIDSQINNQDLGRIETREELKTAEKIMAGAAQSVGVMAGLDFALFKDAGYRGMYNMNLSQLKNYKGLGQSATAYDFMGLEELAGNLFRVTQTAAKIRQNPSMGIRGAMDTAKGVGSEVRQMMIRNSGTAPENLDTEEDVKKVKAKLKNTSKKMLKHDSQK